MNPLRRGNRISSPFAVVAATKQPDATRKLLAFFASEPALAVFRRHGFLTLAK